MRFAALLCLVIIAMMAASGGNVAALMPLDPPAPLAHAL